MSFKEILGASIFRVNANPIAIGTCDSYWHKLEGKKHFVLFKRDAPLSESSVFKFQFEVALYLAITWRLT